MFKLFGRLLEGLFIFIGLVLLVFAFLVAKNNFNFLDHAVETRGVVVDVLVTKNEGKEYFRPVFGFRAGNGDERKFESSIESNPARYRKGEEVIVLYIPGEPDQLAQIKSFFSLWGGAIISAILGGVFLLSSLIPVLLRYRQKEKTINFQKYGLPINTTLLRVEQNEQWMTDVAGGYPYQVVTSWQNPETSETRIFKSDKIWFDPSKYIGNFPIRVFLDKNNPEKYHVDLSFLSKMV